MAVWAHAPVDGEKKKKRERDAPDRRDAVETERNADAESERDPGGWGVYRVERGFKRAENDGQPPQIRGVKCGGLNL